MIIYHSYEFRSAMNIKKVIVKVLCLLFPSHRLIYQSYCITEMKHLYPAVSSFKVNGCCVCICYTFNSVTQMRNELFEQFCAVPK